MQVDLLVFGRDQAFCRTARKNFLAVGRVYSLLDKAFGALDVLRSPRTGRFSWGESRQVAVVVEWVLGDLASVAWEGRVRFDRDERSCVPGFRWGR